MVKRLAAAAIFLVLCTSVSHAAESVFEGRLEYGDGQFGKNRNSSWFDTYPITVQGGDRIRFSIDSSSFLTGGIILDPAGKELYSALGEAGGNGFEYEWIAPESGTFKFLVFQGSLEEGNYRLTVTELD